MEDAIPSGYASGLTLGVAAAEQVILFASGTVRAPHATYQQDGHTHRDQNRQKGAIRCNPVQETLHFEHHTQLRHALRDELLSSISKYASVARGSA